MGDLPQRGKPRTATIKVNGKQSVVQGRKKTSTVTLVTADKSEGEEARCSQYEYIPVTHFKSRLASPIKVT